MTALVAGDNPNVAMARLLLAADPSLEQLGDMATPPAADEQKKDISLVHLAVANPRTPAKLISLLCEWRPFWAKMCDNW